MTKVRLLLPLVLLFVAALGTAQAQNITIVSGNGQVACQVCFGITPKTNFDPLVVKVTDAAGRPLANATVTWNVTQGGGQFTSSTTTTDTSGQTSNLFSPNYDFINLFNLPFQQFTVTAGVATSVTTFTITQVLINRNTPASNQVTALFPAGQAITGQSGTVAPASLDIQVLTALGGPVPGVSVQLATDDLAGGPTAACQSLAGQPAGVTYTDATGTARCFIVFGPKIGFGATFKVIVGGGFSISQAFTFTVTVGPPSLILMISGNNQQATLPGTNLPAPLVAQVSDLGGNPVGGAGVTWQVTPTTSATLFNIRDASAIDGLVSANVKIAAVAGPFQVKVSLTASPSISATFTVQAPSVVISGLNKISGDGQSTSPNTAFSAPLVVQAVTAGAAASGIPVSFTVTSGSANLSAPSAVTNAQGQATVNISAGPTLGPVVVTAAAGNQSVTFNLTVSVTPSLTSDSFLNGASFQSGISPCSVATIRASGIAPGVQGTVAPSLGFGALPYLLANLQVNFSGTPAPLYSVINANGQESVTVEVPCDLPAGTSQVTVSVSGSSKTAAAAIKAASPGIFESIQADGIRRAVLVRPDGSYVNSASNPARRGETIRLYATGLGAVNPAVGTNQIPLPSVDSLVAGTVIVGISNGGVQVISSRMAPNLIGVYEVAFVVPSDVATGDLVLSVAVNPADGSQTQYSQASKIPVL